MNQHNDANCEDFFDYTTPEEFIKELVLDGKVDILELPFSIRTSSALYYAMAFRRIRGLSNRVELHNRYCSSLSRDIRLMPDDERRKQFQNMLDGYSAEQMG